MILWNNFQTELDSFLKSRRANNEKETANYIANKYNSYIKTGKDQYGNGISSSNVEILKNNFYLGLLYGKRGKSKQEIVLKFSQGVLLYWRSIVLEILVSPPGSVSVVSNILTFPGNVVNFNIYNNTDSSILAKNLINAFKIHAKSIRGLTTALVSTGTTLVPTPFSWLSFV